MRDTSTHFFYKYAIILSKIAEIRDYCRNVNLFSGRYVLNNLFIYVFSVYMCVCYYFIENR